MKNKVDTEDLRNKDTIKKTSIEGKFTGPLIFYIVITVIGGTFATGWNIGEFNTPSQALKRFFNTTYTNRYNETITEETLTSLWSLANGLMPLGGAFGGLFTGVSVQKFGHIKSMLLINILVLINVVLFVISKPIKSYEILIIGRVLTGFISGFFCGVCPLYLSEIPPLNLRGFTGAINALAMCIGNLVTNIFGLPILLGTDKLWPYLLGLIIIPAVVHFIGLPFCLESPKYLFITKNKPEEAKRALEKMRGYDNQALIEQEISELEQEKEVKKNQKEISYLSLVKIPSLRRALVVSIILQASQQFSGIIVVIFYSAEIFTKIGLEETTWALYASILIALVETIMHGVCMFFIDSKGRRILLLSGMIGMSASCFVLAITRIFAESVSWFKILAVVAAVVYIIFYSLGPGPIPLLVTAELFDTESRGKAVSIAVFLNWFFNFLVTITFPTIDNAIKGYSFIIYVFNKPSLDDSSQPLPEKCSIQCNFSFEEVSAEIVIRELKRLDINKSPGADGVHSMLLRECAESLSEVLSIIFTESINARTLPDQWKDAHITPIFKKAQKTDPSN
ncbi:unnamed protein product [Brachionus calyciflorus]|uniref:Major facilitator superfamily (MFS) profile domain-containing protein n=1 Tax=Brachionus calyciflorus TaxID=104777 RepID=A0A813NHJ3_9BILA|nr:unnamed protein product [Brachionus calyciflorus]